MGGKKKKIHDFEKEDKMPSKKRKLFDDYDEYGDYEEIDDDLWDRIDENTYDYFDDDDIEDRPKYH